MLVVFDLQASQCRLCSPLCVQDNAFLVIVKAGGPKLTFGGMVINLEEVISGT